LQKMWCTFRACFWWWTATN